MTTDLYYNYVRWGEGGGLNSLVLSDEIKAVPYRP